MPKQFSTYWNAFAKEAQERWESVADMPGADFITLATDPATGHYTRLTRFAPGCTTTALQAHDYCEEIYIVSGSLYDREAGKMLLAGDYACRIPGERHGPFHTDEGCLVLEIAYPGAAAS